jgi:hypothetical protein
MNDINTRCVLIGVLQCSQSFSPGVCGSGKEALQDWQILPARFIAVPEKFLLAMALV